MLIQFNKELQISQIYIHSSKHGLHKVISAYLNKMHYVLNYTEQ